MSLEKDKVYVGSCYRNTKTRDIYKVLDITMDTEALELRVVYVRADENLRAKDDVHWDRPFDLFLKKFEELGP